MRTEILRHILGANITHVGDAGRPSDTTLGETPVYSSEVQVGAGSGYFRFTFGKRPDLTAHDQYQPAVTARGLYR